MEHTGWIVTKADSNLAKLSCINSPTVRNQCPLRCSSEQVFKQLCISTYRRLGSQRGAQEGQRIGYLAKGEVFVSTFIGCVSSMWNPYSLHFVPVNFNLGSNKKHTKQFPARDTWDWSTSQGTLAFCLCTEARFELCLIQLIPPQPHTTCFSSVTRQAWQPQTVSINFWPAVYTPLFSPQYKKHAKCIKQSTLQHAYSYGSDTENCGLQLSNKKGTRQDLYTCCFVPGKAIQPHAEMTKYVH